MIRINLHRLFGTRTYQYLAAITGTLCILSSEMHFGWTSPSLPILISGQYKFTLTGDQALWLAVILLGGTIVGAIFTGYSADILGRKKIILLTCIPLFTGWVLIGLANSAAVLYVARFIAGLSTGISISTLPMYLGEISEPEVRGMLASLCPICVVFGILLVNILGNYLTIPQTAFVASIFPVLLFSTFIWMPESPSFLLRKGRTEEARRTMEILRGKENAEKELKRLEETFKEEMDTKTSVLDLFSNRINRKAAFIAFGLRTVQQFSGTTAITFYCKTIFDHANDYISSNISTIICFLLQLIVAFISSLIVDIFGRRPLLKVSLSGVSITLFLMSVFIYLKDYTSIDTSSYNYVIVIVLFLNVCFTSVGIRNIPLLMMGEMFSPTIKPKALCVGTIFYSILAAVSAKVFYETSDLFGMHVPFLIFAVLTFLSIFFVIFFVPETKGKTLEDIQKELAGKPIDNNSC